MKSQVLNTPWRLSLVHGLSMEEATANPWLILQSVSLARLEKLAREHQFMNEPHVLYHHAGLEVVR
jgi:hypothetical protein